MNYRFKRIFVIVADSVGVGYEPDADKFFNAGVSDWGSNTFVHTAEACGGLNIPVMNSIGVRDLDDIKGTSFVKHPHSYVAKAREKSNGKDTMTGHWEMMG
ncbi:MAG: phosphopentomutase, partial [Bacilli bacterium]|nr:phosphopentomutase [Bacilli bacterium]